MLASLRGMVYPFLAMPRQNRVTPFGDIIASSARGTLMGNRGRLHDERGHIRRPFLGQRWIICRLALKDWWRPVMAPGQYTELFFLDEATALAAGHRPCAECQPERFEHFRALWAAANPRLARAPRPAAPALDALLHAQRLTPRGQKRTYAAPAASLPGGTFVVLPGAPHAYLVLGHWLLRWSPFGYDAAVARPTSAGATIRVLTPRSVVKTLTAGYTPALHPSVQDVLNSLDAN
jgi:hypothetical protein